MSSGRLSSFALRQRDRVGLIRHSTLSWGDAVEESDAFTALCFFSAAVPVSSDSQQVAGRISASESVAGGDEPAPI
jgi:hypothetical protein